MPIETPGGGASGADIPVSAFVHTAVKDKSVRNPGSKLNYEKLKETRATIALMQQVQSVTIVFTPEFHTKNTYM
jgi:hypothetical protein